MEKGGKRGSLAEAPSDCNENAFERESAASKVRFFMGIFSVLSITLQFALLSLLLQLDRTSNTSRQKINLPTDQGGYDESKTTDEKLSARRIQIYWE